MDMIGREQLEAALSALGELLAARRVRYEVVLVGGGNLILRGLITRPTTKDLDILGERALDLIRPLRPMPEPLRDAVMDVGRAFGLANDWLNVGPDPLLDLGLPDGFTERLERRDFGGLVVWLAGSVRHGVLQALCRCRPGTAEPTLPGSRRVAPKP